MWNPLKKFGQWMDSASNALAQNQLSSGGPISADDLDPRQKRAYLGMLISSLGSGLSALGAGAAPNVMGNYMVGSSALNEQFSDQIRRRKIQEILRSDMPLPQKIQQVAALGDTNTANALQTQLSREWQERDNSSRPTHVFQGLDPDGKLMTYGLYNGKKVPLAPAPVPYDYYNAGDRYVPAPKFGPPGLNASIPVGRSPDKEADMRQKEASQAWEREVFERMFPLRKQQADSEKTLNDVRAQQIRQAMLYAQQERQNQQDPMSAAIGKTPETTKQTLVQYMSVLKGLDQLYSDISQYGKYTIGDILGVSKRGSSANTLINTMVELLKGPLGTGVLQEHEANRIKEILGNLNSFKSVGIPREAILASLAQVREIMQDGFRNYVSLLGGKLPPGFEQWMNPQGPLVSQGEGQSSQNVVKLYKGPDGKYYLVGYDGRGDNGKR